MAKIGFHVDEHMPHGVAESLGRHGVDAETSTEAGLLGASDLDHLIYARARGWMLVTCDADYLRLNGEGLQHAGIAYCSHDPRSYGYIGHLVDALLLIHAVL